MKNFYKKYKVIIYIVLFILIMLTAFLMLKGFLFPDDYKSVYGSRLNGIEDVKFDSNRSLAIKNAYSTDTLIQSVKVDLRGRTINIIIKGNEGYNMDIAKKSISDNLKAFNEKELKYYDIQFFVTNETLKYNMIGYKNKASDVVVFSEYKEEVVDET